MRRSFAQVPPASRFTWDEVYGDGKPVDLKRYWIRQGAKIVPLQRAQPTKAMASRSGATTDGLP